MCVHVNESTCVLVLQTLLVGLQIRFTCPSLQSHILTMCKSIVSRACPRPQKNRETQFNDVTRTQAQYIYIYSTVVLYCQMNACRYARNRERALVQLACSWRNTRGGSQLFVHLVRRYGYSCSGVSPSTALQPAALKDG